MKERKPYPFFFSVEFLTVACKVFGTLSLALPLMITSGFKPESALIFIGAILEGFLLSAKELQIHQNLYTPIQLVGRNKDEAIANIAISQAAEIAKNSHSTIEQILDTKKVGELVDLAVKPSIVGAARTLLKRLF